MKVEKIKLEPRINEEMYTDTNGKLTIYINTKENFAHIYFGSCIISTVLLKKGRKGNVDIMEHLVFLGHVTLPLAYFSDEQLQYLKEFI